MEDFHSSTRQDEKAICRELGTRIREARTRAGLTQAELGERLGIGQVSIAQYEAGAVDLSYSRLVLLAAGLNVSLAWLAAGNNHNLKINTAQILRELADRIDYARREIYSSAHQFEPAMSPGPERLAEEIAVYLTAKSEDTKTG